MYTIEEIQQIRERTRKALSGDLPAFPAMEAAELRELIRFHDWLYYVKSDPLLTDADYDKLYRRLKQTEQQHPELFDPDSPTNRVSGGITNEFASVAHLASMLSLENAFGESDLEEFDRRVKDFANQQPVSYAVEPKFDGASIALVYEGDRLLRAATRGDGAVGEEITLNARAISTIPLTAPFSKFGIHRIELRGEVVIEKKDFEQLNREKEAAGQKPFQNARNAASGSLRMKNPTEVAERKLTAILYHISYAVNQAGDDVLGSAAMVDHAGNISLLNQCGFRSTINELKVFDNIRELHQMILQWGARERDHFPIETDGMVIKVNRISLQKICGQTSHHPRWAIAYKYQARQAQTRLLKVEFQVGRTGAVTPVAKLEPVALSGVTVSSVSLHNQEFIEEKDIRINDMVLVERAGEVIPYISAVNKDFRNGSEYPVVFPTHCPSCAELLVKPEEESVWRCDNAECPAQTEERIIHFVSKEAMDIDGLGRSSVLEFVAKGWLNNVADLYRLPYAQLMSLEGWGEKSVQKLKEGIEKSKSQPLWRLINALGIRHVGITTAKDIARQLTYLPDAVGFSSERWMEIEGIGPKVAHSLVSFFSHAGNLHLLRQLEELGLNLHKPEEAKEDSTGPLSGKTFLFTGTLSQLSRQQAQQLVEQNGGKLLSGVSANLNYLVAGEEAGSKLAKARKFPEIQIITEQEFLQLLES